MKKINKNDELMLIQFNEDLARGDLL